MQRGAEVKRSHLLGTSCMDRWVGRTRTGDADIQRDLCIHAAGLFFQQIDRLGDLHVAFLVFLNI